MNILGIHGHVKREDEDATFGFALHDAAAVLLRDGVLVAAVEEERLNRLKHANTFPVLAIANVLDVAGLSFDDIDCIALNRAEACFDQLLRAHWLTDSSSRAHTARATMADAFRQAFGVDVASKLSFCPHHLAHAWSAWAPSGFSDSLVFVADGDGDGLSGMMLLASGGRLSVLREYSLANSLGNLYSLIIGLIGYGRFDEYKAMGLAPYGDPATYDRVFAARCQLLPEGDYALAPRSAWIAAMDDAGLLAGARRRGEPFTQQHMDIAAALQATIQRIVLHVLTHYARQTGATRLCLAGGVCHNCSLNGSILYSGLFHDVFVQPAAHDAGGAYGAAVHAAIERGDPLPTRRWEHVYFGNDIGCGEPLRLGVERWREFVDVEYAGASPAPVAQLLADGQVVGWVHGRAEFGPRALGHRSILADPRPAANKDRINGMVKKREAFRPFAPVVLAERLHEYFDVPAHVVDLPFMMFVVKVRGRYRELLGAITHVDGTARVQTVSRRTNDRLWRLLRSFEERTAVGMLLNTSFNNNAEPIVDSADDAIGCFLTTGLDAMVIGDYLLRRRAPEIGDEAMQRLVPRLAGFRKLVTQRRRHPLTHRLETVHAAQTTRSRYFGPPDTALSEPMFRVLHRADGCRTLGDLAQSTGVAGRQLGEVCVEARRLWRERVVGFVPGDARP